MKYVLPWLVVGGLLVTGCGSEGVSKTGGGPSSKPSPGGAQAGKLDLGPDNAKIEFIGTHVGDKPDPRTGGFAKFTGKAEFDPAAKTLQAVSVDIDTSSIWTEFDKLTNHLNSPDFFDTREHPTAKFVSTKITPGSGDKPTEIAGNLTLLGKTKEITFPATVNVEGDGLKLSASFTIDRTDFGMDKLTDKVEKPVKLNVAIGEKPQPKKPAGG